MGYKIVIRLTSESTTIYSSYHDKRNSDRLANNFMMIRI